MLHYESCKGFPDGSVIKNPPAMQETQVDGFKSWVRKSPWRRKWQPTPVIFAWKIPWTEEPGGLQSCQDCRGHRDGHQ